MNAKTYARQSGSVARRLLLLPALVAALSRAFAGAASARVVHDQIFLPHQSHLGSGWRERIAAGSRGSQRRLRPRCGPRDLQHTFLTGG